MEVKRIAGKDVDRAGWRSLLETSPQGMFYSLPGYLDIVAPGWEGLEAWESGKRVALMPFQLKKKYGLQYMLQAPFSQYWGPAIADKAFKSPYQEYRFKRKVVKALAAALPASRLCSFSCAPAFDYPLPFHWAGYKIASRISYHLDLSPSPDNLHAAFGNDTRYDLRKSESWDEKIIQSSDPAPLIQLLESAKGANGKILDTGSLQLFKRLSVYLNEEGLISTWVAGASPSEPLAAGLFVHFARKTVYLMSAQHPGKKVPGLMTRILWNAIREAREKSAVFDFEGSMIEGIEGFFRGFSPRPVPYFLIQKNALPLPIQWIVKPGF